MPSKLKSGVVSNGCVLEPVSQPEGFRLLREAEAMNIMIIWDACHNGARWKDRDAPECWDGKYYDTLSSAAVAGMAYKRWREKGDELGANMLNAPFATYGSPPAEAAKNEDSKDLRETILNISRARAASLRAKSQAGNSFDPGFVERGKQAFAAAEIEKLLAEIRKL